MEANLSDVFRKTDRALETLGEWPTFKVEEKKIFNTKILFRIRLEDYRYSRNLLQFLQSVLVIILNKLVHNLLIKGQFFKPNMKH